MSENKKLTNEELDDLANDLIGRFNLSIWQLRYTNMSLWEKRFYSEHMGISLNNFILVLDHITSGTYVPEKNRRRKI